MGSEVFLGDLRAKLLERYAPGSEDELALSEIREHWKEIAGPLCKHTYPAKLCRAELFIHAEHAAYVQELQFLKNELRKRILKTADISIKKIKIQRKKIERAGTSIANKKPKPKAPLSEKEIAVLQKILEQIP